MSTRLAILAGILAPLLYAATVVLGGLLTPGYSHVADPISALIQSGAPAKPILDLLFTAYNLLLIGFGLGLSAVFAERGERISPLAPAMLALIGALGLVMAPLPMDPIGAALTVRGTAHIVIAGLQSLSTIAAILALAVSLRRYPAWRRFSAYSLVTLAILLLSGGLAAWAVAHRSPLTGLAERVTIGAFQQWIFVLAVRLSGRRVAA